MQLLTKATYRCRQHESRQPDCPSCQLLVRLERRLDRLHQDRSRLFTEIKKALANQDLIIIDLH